jgi:hypothetical protein
MGIESSELIESQVWLDLDLDQIMARHELLTKTGKYFFPDPKRPQFKKVGVEEALIQFTYNI